MWNKFEANLKQIWGKFETSWRECEATLKKIESIHKEIETKLSNALSIETH